MTYETVLRNLFLLATLLQRALRRQTDGLSGRQTGRAYPEGVEFGVQIPPIESSELLLNYVFCTKISSQLCCDSLNS